MILIPPHDLLITPINTVGETELVVNPEAVWILFDQYRIQQETLAYEFMKNVDMMLEKSVLSKTEIPIAEISKKNKVEKEKMAVFEATIKEELETITATFTDLQRQDFYRIWRLAETTNEQRIKLELEQTEKRLQQMPSVDEIEQRISMAKRGFFQKGSKPNKPSGWTEPPELARIKERYRKRFRKRLIEGAIVFVVLIGLYWLTN